MIDRSRRAAGRAESRVRRFRIGVTGATIDLANERTHVSILRWAICIRALVVGGLASLRHTP